LADARDGKVVASERPGDLRENAGLIDHGKHDVVANVDVVLRFHPRVVVVAGAAG
jgi:hypothetical protein